MESMKSESIINPVWEINQKPLVDNSITKYDHFEIRETNINVKTLTKFEFISRDTSNWLLPSKGYIHIKLKILNNNEDNVSLVNNGFNIFSDAEYLIENTSIEKNEYVGLTTLIHNLSTFSDDYSRSAATNMFWFPDTAEGCDKSKFVYNGAETELDTNAKIKDVIKNITANINYNNGHLERYKLTNKSKQVSLYLPLSRLFGFLKTDRVFIGVSHTFRFQKNDISNLLFTNTNNNYDIELSHCSIFMPYVVPSLAVSLQLEKLLIDLETDILWSTSQTYRSNLQNDKEFVWKTTTTQYNPVRAFIVFQYESQVNNIKGNNMVFEHMNVNMMSIHLNENLKFPSDGFECDFTETSLDYSRVYQSFLTSGFKHLDFDTGTVVSYQDFARVYPIYHIDLSMKPENLFESRSTTDITLRVKMNKTPTSNYYCYVVLVSERIAKLNPTSNRTLVNIH
jgi:hypothetical protein